MTATAKMITKPCDRCGNPVEREVISGVLADLAEKLKPICADCEKDAEREDETARQMETQQQRVREAAGRIANSGLPGKYHALTLDELDHDPALIAAALSWVVDGGGLLLTGKVGHGKTMIAGVAARARLERSSVSWLTAPLLFARLGSGLDSPQRDEALNAIAGRHALVLDDVDKTRPTEYGAEQIFLAVDQRVEHKAPLLLTSNLAPSQLAERWPEPYGPAIASRLVGYCRVLRVEGVDRRLGQARGRRAETGDLVVSERGDD